MLGRISFAQTHRDIRYAIATQNLEKNKIGNQLSTQNSVQELRDDPIAASHGSRYASLLVRKEAFIEQNRETYDSLQYSEGYLKQMIDIFQAGRELAVRAANGTFAKSDRIYMAEEINQFIEEMGVTANAQDADGRYIFGGARTNIPPFRTLRTVSDRMNKDVITEVEYVGSNKSNMIEISDKDLVQRSIPGSELLWARQTHIVGNRDVMAYSVEEDSEIIINNIPIALSRGDSIHAIITKINQSQASMNASLNTFTGKLQLQGTDSEQVWISDASGVVMQDLGIINDTGNPPFNISGDANIFEETVFDTLVLLRDSMYSNDYNDIGGRALASIDKSMNSVLEGLGKVGAITERLDVVYERLDSKDVPNLTKQLDEQVAIDIADTIIRWQELLNAQQASYQVSSQIMQTSLLNYLK